MNKIKVIVCEGGKEPEVKEITSHIDEYRKLVGGWIEVFPIDGRFLVYYNSAPSDKRNYRIFRGLSVYGTMVITRLFSSKEVSLNEKEILELITELMIKNIDVN